ncbi:MAG TPA: STAS domain-containing protein, partial [Vicinamibacteria bacterium]|nr:STAS domain-containing protein [Vicinamibacteria bacterium]
IVLASLLFMRRMAEVTGVRLAGDGVRGAEFQGGPLPRGMLVYSIGGPLFFGAAQKAIEAIEQVDRRGVKVAVLDLRAVPAVDATGLVALESLLERLNHDGVKVVLAGVQAQPLRVFARAGWRNRRGRLRIFRDFDAGVRRARAHAARPKEGESPAVTA